MCSKLPIHENSLLEQYELCKHHLRVRVVPTYNRREPPIRLQQITRLERLGDKPLTNTSKFCIWSEMDLKERKSNSKIVQKPTITPNIHTNSAIKNTKPVKAKESMIWIFKPSRPLYESKTNIFELTKQNELQSTLTLTNANSTKNANKNFKLKRTVSKTLIDAKVSKQFWNNEIIKNLLPKPRTRISKVGPTELVKGIEKKDGRHCGGTNQMINIKKFPIYSTSSFSQLSVAGEPKVKKITSKRVKIQTKVENNKIINNKNNILTTTKKVQKKKCEDSIKEISKTTTSSPFSTSESHNLKRPVLRKNVQKDACQVLFHNPVSFKLTNKNSKSILKSKTLKKM